MERKTYIVTIDEKSSVVGVMPAFGNSRYDKVTITKPVSVTALDGFPTLCRAEALEKERQEGQNEAWELARRIMRRYECGGYTIADLRQAFEVTEVVPDRDVPGVCILMEDFATASSNLRKVEEKKAKEFHPGDVVTLTWRSRVHKAVVTTVLHDMLSVVFDTGDIDNVGKNRCTKTGKTLGIAAMLVELNGEEE